MPGKTKFRLEMIVENPGGQYQGFPGLIRDAREGRTVEKVEGVAP